MPSGVFSYFTKRKKSATEWNSWNYTPKWLHHYIQVPAFHWLFPWLFYLNFSQQWLHSHLIAFDFTDAVESALTKRFCTKFPVSSNDREIHPTHMSSISFPASPFREKGDDSTTSDWSSWAKGCRPISCHLLSVISSIQLPSFHTVLHLENEQFFAV